MDTIYSNKKYLQSLNSADYYRTGTLRPSGNDYASYQNTMSRRSTLFGAYSQHQPNMTKYSYPPTDVSLSSHYGYTSWGLWRDTGNLSPSIYSKKRINIRSFSILIMSAAFIVVLAVLAVAGLAFYFSTFKSDPSESFLVFDCAFRVAKGDVFTSGLKYNHTAVYRQKANFYTKFIETSLEHGSFNVAKTEINSFGNGPDIHLDFRIYLDMRKIQMTITNVEEHIKNAFISETATTESTFKNLKIDSDTIEIKRLLDQEVLRQASFFKEQTQEPNTMIPTTVIPLDELSNNKKVMSTEKVKPTLSTSTSKYSTKKKDSYHQKGAIHESDIDMENLPVIQGSFEITKTDADIAQKRSDANQRLSTASLTTTTTTATTNTLKPFFISPASIKIKDASEKQSTENANQNIVEMFLQHQKQQQQFAQQQQSNIKEPVTAKIEKTNKNGETTIGKTPPTTKTTTSTTTTMTPTTTKAKTTTTTTTTTTTAKPTTTQMLTKESTTISIIQPFAMDRMDVGMPEDSFESQVNEDLPKLDVSLFTSAPVLDNEPWRPINPLPSQIRTNFPPAIVVTTELNGISSTESAVHYRSPFQSNAPMETVMYRNKFTDPEMAFAMNDTNESVFYQSFHNPDFSAGDLAIEKLGIADVKPYQLPINKIDLSENPTIPEFKFISPDLTAAGDMLDGGEQLNYDENKFEHLGGGVIAKRPSMEVVVDAVTIKDIINDYEDTTVLVPAATAGVSVSAEEIADKLITTELPTQIGDIFKELLNFDENIESLSQNSTKNYISDVESRVIPDEDAFPIISSTERLNFMNMKDFIVHMEKSKSGEEDLSSETPSMEMISSTNIQTTEKPTTTFVEVQTLKYQPTTVVAIPAVNNTAHEPQLFPAISKWEFVNGTRQNSTESSVTKKVFNETLQAVVVENFQTNPHLSRIVSDFKANRTIDKTNLQQLSSIFDTLAAKLGIKTDAASKMPPFSQHSQHKLKQQNNANNNRTKMATTRKPNTNSKITSIPASKQRPTTKLTTTRTTPKTTKVTTTTTTTTTKAPQMEILRKVDDNFATYESSSEAIIIGQAEVEAIDPTQYEEMLSQASSPIARFSTTTPSLITLLPVKSNSGIRNFNPRVKFPLPIKTPQQLPQP
ncbi:unnamed protein product, partial [Diamesa hyperborea]